MGYQIITKMVYNARTHQIETWQHSNNVRPRTDHFCVLDVRTDEQLFRFITMVAEGSWQTRKWRKAFETLRCSGNIQNCAWIPTGMNSKANPGRSIAQSAADTRNLPEANVWK